MKHIGISVVVLGVVFGVGSAIVLKVERQDEFSAQVANFIGSGVSKIEICSEVGSNAVNCTVVKEDATFRLIASALSGNEPRVPPGHAVPEFERVIKLYRQEAMLFFRAVEFEGHQGVIYLESVLPDATCATFKFGPHSLVAKGLSKTLLMDGAAPNPSIEGTSPSKLRLLAAAPHVKR